MKNLYLLLTIIIISSIVSFASEIDKNSNDNILIVIPDSTDIIEKIVVNSVNFGTYRVLFSYNEHGRMIMNTMEFNDYGDVWRQSEKRDYLYDENGRMLSYSGFYLHSGVWDNGYSNTFTYDERGNEIEYFYKYWDDEWINSERRTRTYNEMDSLLTETYEEWKGNDWVVNNRLTQEFDENGNRISQTYETTNSGALDFDYRYQFTFDEHGWRTSYTHDVWDGEWITYIKGLYEYNEEGLWIATYTEGYNNEVWEPLLRVFFEHNSNGDRTKIQQDNRVDNEWKTMYVWDYTYNENFDTLSIVYQQDNYGEMMNNYRKIYNYDENYNLLNGKYDKWVAGQWIKNDYSFRITDAYGNSSGFRGSNFDIIYRGSTVVNENNVHPFSIFCSPNPTTGPLSIDYFLENNENVSLSLFNSQGLEIIKLIDGHYQSSGKRRIEENLENLPSGSYFLNMRTSKKNEIQKIIINK
ncbi:MAG: T9SS type A sorting domain-containing protein [bacterium]